MVGAMTQRLVAACIALPMVLGLLLYSSLARLPYATFSPGSTVDVLGQDGGGSEIVQVVGHRPFRDGGELRMTTVGVSPAQQKDARGLSLGRLLSVWFDGDDAVYPYDFVHPDDQTQEESRQQGAVQMATSQDDAVAVALTELGLQVPQRLTIASLSPDEPAVDVLEVGDQIVSANGVAIGSDPKVADDEELRRVILAAPRGKPIDFEIKRAGDPKTVTITPAVEGDRQVVGISQFGVDYDFPFQVKINISSDIGGPSAGLMFSLAVYDTLTPGSLTGEHAIAGTGEIAPDGQVGPIGGIQQKIAGARDAGAELFIMPQGNCDDAQNADPGDMRLMKGTTMHEVRLALQKYATDPTVALPSCKDAP